MKAALIPVPHALKEIGDYLHACFEAWEREKPDERPQPPSEALRIIMEAAPYVDDASFVSFQQLIINSQVFESRIGSPGRQRPYNVLDDMIVDIAILSYLTTRLYELGRMDEEVLSVPFVKPTRADIEKVLRRDFDLKLRVETDPVLQRVERALRMRFHGTNGWPSKLAASEVDPVDVEG